MTQKIYDFSLDLEIKAVSCPGVWLCQRAKVSLVVEALGSTYETKAVEPIFPLKFHELIYFNKLIDNASCLQELQSALSNEYIYANLIQWFNESDNGTVIAKYQGVISDLLYSYNACSADSVGLLMEKTEKFPGIISPKIEVITKVKIDEIIDDGMWKIGSIDQRQKISPSYPIRQKPVCHTHDSEERKFDPIDEYGLTHIKTVQHYQSMCPICSKYNRMFDSEKNPCDIDAPYNKFEQPSYKISDDLLLSSTIDNNVGNNIHRKVEKIFTHKSTDGRRKYGDFQMNADETVPYNPVELAQKYNATKRRCFCYH